MKRKSWPWIKDYPADHLSDARLLLVSLAGRGLYRDLFALAYLSEDPGKLVMQSKPVTAAQIAGLRNAPVETVKSALDELKVAGLISISRDGMMQLPALTDSLNARFTEAKRKRDHRKMSGECPGNVREKSGDMQRQKQKQTADSNPPPAEQRRVVIAGVEVNK